MANRSEQVGDRPSDSASGESDAEFRTKWSHEFPDSYAGPVWITVESPDAGLRAITIIWGPWQRQIRHEGTEPISYLFSKEPGSSAALTVEAEPAAKVTFESGTPPPDAVDVNAGWTRTGG